MTAQISIMVKCAMKAVRESMNTRTKIGTMAKGRIYTWMNVLRMNTAVRRAKMTMRA